MRQRAGGMCRHTCDMRQHTCGMSHHVGGMRHAGSRSQHTGGMRTMCQHVGGLESSRGRHESACRWHESSCGRHGKGCRVRGLLFDCEEEPREHFAESLHLRTEAGLHLRTGRRRTRIAFGRGRPHGLGGYTTPSYYSQGGQERRKIVRRFLRRDLNASVARTGQVDGLKMIMWRTRTLPLLRYSSLPSMSQGNAITDTVWSSLLWP
eukprot:1190652-Prorocentrum_minimum.AAC.4